MSARIAPAVRMAEYVPVGPRALVHPRPFFKNHRLAEGVYL